MSTGLTSLCIFLLLRRFAGGAATGILAAMVFLTCFLVLGVGTYNVLDAPLSLLLTAALACFYFAFADNEPGRPRTLFMALFGVFCGLAFMAKGFLALVIPVIVIVPYMLWQRRLVEFLKVCLLPLGVAVLVALPWALAIHHRQPDFWRYFFWVEHVQRFTSPSAGQHPYPFWYFVPILLAGLLPWTGLAGCCVSGLRQVGLKDPFVRFCLCWLVVPFVFFSLSSGKLATYILPCFPPLAMLVISAFRSTSRRLIRILQVRPQSHHPAAGVRCRHSHPPGPAVAAGDELRQPQVLASHLYRRRTAQMAVSGRRVPRLRFFTWLAIRASHWHRKLVLSCLGPMVLFPAGQYLIPGHFFDGKAPGPLLERHTEGLSPSTVLVTDKYSISAVCWYYRRADAYIIGGEGELKYGTVPGAGGRLMTPEDFASLLASSPGWDDDTTPDPPGPVCRL